MERNGYLLNGRRGMGSGVVVEPVCEEGVVEDGRLLALLVEIKEEVVRVGLGSVLCGIHGWAAAWGGGGREGGEGSAGEWREDGSN